MPKETMTVRIAPGTRKALDSIAAGLDRDRSYVVNAALAAYIETHHWQIEHIQRGLREAEAGEFASESQVNRTIERLRRG